MVLYCSQLIGQLCGFGTLAGDLVRQGGDDLVLHLHLLLQPDDVPDVLLDQTVLGVASFRLLLVHIVARTDQDLPLGLRGDNGRLVVYAIRKILNVVEGRLIQLRFQIINQFFQNLVLFRLLRQLILHLLYLGILRGNNMQLSLI